MPKGLSFTPSGGRTLILEVPVSPFSEAFFDILVNLAPPPGVLHVPRGYYYARRCPEPPCQDIHHMENIVYTVFNEKWTEPENYGDWCICAHVGNRGREESIMRHTWNLLGLSEVTQLCLTLCDPMDCSLPCSSVHGIFQARKSWKILEWVAISFSRGSF